MRLWLAPNRDVTLHEQLVTQVVLGILAGDLKPGARLPSTRELARRFAIHPNTVSAAYKDLVRQGWLELRRGSGVYVRRRRSDATPKPEAALDQSIAGVFRTAREYGIALDRVRARIAQWLETQRPDHILLIEPGDELRAIVIEELRTSLAFPVRGAGISADGLNAELVGAIPVALPGTASEIQPLLPPHADCVALQVRSVTTELALHLPAPGDALVGIASRLPAFLKMAQTMLLAAGFETDRLVVRNACEPGWKRGLAVTAAVVCDCLTAAQLPRGCRALIFRILADSAIADLNVRVSPLRQD